MTQTPNDPDLAVRVLIDRLFDDVEPPHRPGMAETSISFGQAAARRRGYVTGGVTLSVLAIAAGAFAVQARGHAGSGLGSQGPAVGASSPAYEDSRPTYSDKLREIHAELPGLLTPLLPAGMTVRYDPGRPSPVSGRTGEVASEFVVVTGTGDFYMRVNEDAVNFETAFSAQPASVAVPVAGGSIRVRNDAPTSVQPAAGFMTFFEYTPGDETKPSIRFSFYGDGTTVPLDTVAFVKLVDAPGFKGLATLLDPAAPASAEAVRQRYLIEAAINREAAHVLPPGFRLKLGPAATDELELVGPRGVNILEWSDGPDVVGLGCPAATLCFREGTDSYRRIGLDGGPRMGTYGYVADSVGAGVVTISVAGKPALGMAVDPVAVGKPASESAPLGPGLTPREAMVIVKAPDLARVITEVQQAAAA